MRNWYDFICANEKVVTLNIKGSRGTSEISDSYSMWGCHQESLQEIIITFCMAYRTTNRVLSRWYISRMLRDLYVRKRFPPNWRILSARKAD